MCLKTVDKKRKTGIKVGYKYFKLRDGVLKFPHQFDRTPVILGEKSTREVNHRGFILSTDKEEYPCGFHFFIDLEECKQVTKRKRLNSPDSNYVIVRCKVKKVHTTGIQTYKKSNTYKVFRIDAQIGVCDEITIEEVIYPKKENRKCQKSTT